MFLDSRGFLVLRSVSRCFSVFRFDLSFLFFALFPPVFSEVLLDVFDMFSIFLNVFMIFSVVSVWCFHELFRFSSCFKVLWFSNAVKST